MCMGTWSQERTGKQSTGCQLKRAHQRKHRRRPAAGRLVANQIQEANPDVPVFPGEETIPGNKERETWNWFWNPLSISASMPP